MSFAKNVTSAHMKIRCYLNTWRDHRRVYDYIIVSLSTRSFLRCERQPEENISRGKTVLSPRFLYYSSLMKQRYLAMWMWLCEDKFKVKIAHFRLPSVPQKHACLSSLINCAVYTGVYIINRILQAWYEFYLLVLNSIPHFIRVLICQWKFRQTNSKYLSFSKILLRSNSFEKINVTLPRTKVVNIRKHTTTPSSNKINKTVSFLWKELI